MRTIPLWLTLSLLIASNATAQDSWRGYGEVGYESLAEDSYLSLRPGLDFVEDVKAVGCETDECFTQLRLSVHLPLRLTLIDEAPIQDSLIREQDWDEPSDYARVLKRFEYGFESDAVHIAVGELSFVDLGHGTLVSDYVNNVQINTYQPGVKTGLNSMYGGVEVLMDNLFSPSLAAGRAFIRPFGFDEDNAWWQEFDLGVSVASDFNAPLVVSPDGPRTVDTYEAPAVSSSTNRSVAGVDLGFAYEGEFFDVLPYVDVNFGGGVGTHVGSDLTLRGEKFEVWSRVEGRFFSSGYIPQYFGTLYDIERFQFSGWGQRIGAPKARVAADTESGNGMRLTLGTAFYQYVSVELDWSNNSIAESDLFAARLNIRPVEGVSLGAYYYKGGGVDLVDLFDPDGAVIVSELRSRIWGPFYAVGRFDQKYRLGDNGTYTSTVDYLIGGGVDYTW